MENGHEEGTPGKGTSLPLGLRSPEASLALWGCFLLLWSRYLSHCSSQDFQKLLRFCVKMRGLPKVVSKVLFAP